MSFETIIEKLKEAPDSQVSPFFREMIKEWSLDTTAEQITEVRNKAAFTSECSSLVITVLNALIMLAPLNKETS